MNNSIHVNSSARQYQDAQLLVLVLSTEKFFKIYNRRIMLSIKKEMNSILYNFLPAWQMHFKIGNREVKRVEF